MNFTTGKRPKNESAQIYEKKKKVESKTPGLKTAQLC